MKKDLRVYIQEYNIGIFTWNDMTAFEVMNLCREQQIKSPDDIQIRGYDEYSYVSMGQ